MAFNGTKHFPKNEIVDVPGIARDAVRAERQRVHELRRNRLHAAGPDRQAGRARSRLPDPRGLGARADVRPGRDRQGARRRHRGVAQPARRGGPHAGQAAADHRQGIALRRAHPDRNGGQPAALQARAADGVLRRLVSPRPHDGDRGRRLRPGGGGTDDQGALRADPRGEVAASPRQPTPSRTTRGRSTPSPRTRRRPRRP